MTIKVNKIAANRHNINPAQKARSPMKLKKFTTARTTNPSNQNRSGVIH